MALRVLLLAAAVLGVLGVLWDSDNDEDPVACNLLQTKLSLRKPQRNPGNITVSVANGICLPGLTPKEASEPWLELTARYNEDGWCLAGFMGGWASGCAVSRRERDVIPYTKLFEPAYQSYLNVTWATPFALRLPDNRTLIVRDHNYPLDDLYCFVNGWYSLDRAQTVNNFSYLEEVSDRSCNHLAQTVPGYYNISIRNLSAESDYDGFFLANLMKDGADAGYVSQKVIDGMYLHAAAKCVMRGGNRGAVCDVANCAARGCFASPTSSELLYTVRGECKDSRP